MDNGAFFTFDVDESTNTQCVLLKYETPIKESAVCKLFACKLYVVDQINCLIKLKYLIRRYYLYTVRVPFTERELLHLKIISFY